MDQEKFGRFIKEIRKKHNLTQKEFADKYNVTYQAVSKWENGKNIPDISLIKKISEDFNISMEELYNGEYKNKKKNILPFVIIILIIIGIVLFVIFHNDDFKFQTLSANCQNFTISGSVAYNSKKSAIYISNIEYCGKKSEEKYNKIECTLYEVNGDTERKISSYRYNKNEKISLDEFLKQVKFAIDDYENTCKVYKDNTLFLKVNGNNEGKTTTYEVPLKIDSSCKK